jgi:uncharacterized protein (DUF427 family)
MHRLATPPETTEDPSEMTDKPIMQPGPDHPITIEPNPARVVVIVAGQTVADRHAP